MTYLTLTGQELADNLNRVVEPLGKVAIWEHTGGGCAAIVVGTGPYPYRADSSFLMVTPAEDIFTMADRDRSLEAEWGEQWEEFYVGHYARDPDERDWFAEEAHYLFINGLENLAAAVAEWCQTGAISGWEVRS